MTDEQYEQILKGRIEETYRQWEKHELLVKHGDSIIIWLTGLSALILLAILYNFDKLEHLMTRIYLTYSLYFIFASVASALLFRTLLYLLLVNIAIFHTELVKKYNEMMLIHSIKWKNKMDEFNKEMKDPLLKGGILRKGCKIMAVAAVIFFILAIFFLVLGATQHIAIPAVVPAQSFISL